MVGDRILSVNGQRVWLSGDVELLLDRNENDTVDLVVERGGERVALNDLPLTRMAYSYNGTQSMMYGFNWAEEELTPIGRLRLAGCQSSGFRALGLVRPVRPASRPGRAAGYVRAHRYRGHHQRCGGAGSDPAGGRDQRDDLCGLCLRSIWQ